MLVDLLTALQASEIATALRRSFWVYPLVNAGHIFGLAMIFGAILPLDMRLIGLWRDLPWPPLARVLVPVAVAGVILSLLTGIALFSARPLDYAFKPLFQIKLAILTIAIGNALALRLAAGWKEAEPTSPDFRLKLSAWISVIAWSGVILCGRLIGYY